MEYLLCARHSAEQRFKRHGFWFQGDSSLVEETEFQKCSGILKIPEVTHIITAGRGNRFGSPYANT